MPSCLKNPWWSSLKQFLVKLFLPRAQVDISLAKAKSTRSLTARICHPSNKSEQGKEIAKKGSLNCGKKTHFSQPWQRSISTDWLTPSLNPFSSHLHKAKHASINKSQSLCKSGFSWGHTSTKMCQNVRNIWPQNPPSSPGQSPPQSLFSPLPEPIHTIYSKRITQGWVPNAVINSQYLLHTHQLIPTSVNRFTQIRARARSWSNEDFDLFGILTPSSLIQENTGCTLKLCHSSSSFLIFLLYPRLCISVFVEVFTFSSIPLTENDQSS